MIVDLGGMQPDKTPTTGPETHSKTTVALSFLQRSLKSC